MLPGEKVSLPKVVSPSRVMEFGGLRPLTDRENQEISKIIGLDINTIADPVRVRIAGEPIDGWFPDFADIIAFIIRESPKSHYPQSIKEWFLGKGRYNYIIAAGYVRMPHPQTGKEGVFRVMYPYHDGKAAEEV